MLLGKPLKVYETFTKVLDDMPKRGVDRVLLLLDVYETGPNKTPNLFTDTESTAGKFTESGSDEDLSKYYPFEMLTKNEQEIILNKKDYDIGALVLRNVGGVVNYSDIGFEIYQRRRGYPFLNRSEPESNFNYITQGGIYTGDELEYFAKVAKKWGWTEEAIIKRAEASIQEWHDETIELMDKAGVFERKASKGMENGSYMPKTDRILLEMRAQIEKVEMGGNAE
jgi:hypothetical protein